MKKLGLFAIALLISIMTFTACADSKTLTIEGETQTIEPYGIFDNDIKDHRVEYRIVVENLIPGFIFSETLIVPLWLIGWQTHEPVRVKPEYLTKNSMRE